MYNEHNGHSYVMTFEADISPIMDFLKSKYIELAGFPAVVYKSSNLKKWRTANNAKNKYLYYITYAFNDEWQNEHRAGVGVNSNNDIHEWSEKLHPLSMTKPDEGGINTKVTFYSHILLANNCVKTF